MTGDMLLSSARSLRISWVEKGGLPRGRKSRKLVRQAYAAHPSLIPLVRFYQDLVQINPRRQEISVGIRSIPFSIPARRHLRASIIPSRR